MSAAVINAELQAALVGLLAAADEVFAAKTDGAEQVAIAGLALPRQTARNALDDIRRAARAAPVSTEPLPAFYRVRRERSYDQRAKALIAFNTCAGDLDDKLDAAWAAALPQGVGS